MIRCWALVAISHVFLVLALAVFQWMLQIYIAIIKLFVLLLRAFCWLEYPFEDLVVWLSSYIRAIIYFIVMSWLVIIIGVCTIVSSNNRALLFFVPSYDSWRSIVCLASWMILTNRHVIVLDWRLHWELFNIMVILMSHEVIVVLSKMYLW